jgi:sugar lactone lactonase YvrE
MVDATARAPRWAALPGERFTLGEGLRDVGGSVVMVDILSGRLLELPHELSGPPRMLRRLGEPLGAVAPLVGGNGWIAAGGTGIALFTEGGGVRWLARPEKGAPHRMRMNDAAADPSGRFWAGSMAFDEVSGAGSVYRVDSDGTVHRVLAGFTVPNGFAFTPDGDELYLADTPLGVIYRYPVDPRTGELGERVEFARVAEGGPDGMTVDVEGYLWAAIWGAGEVRRFAPTGSVDRVLSVPARQPTSVCLAGGRLLVTTASVGLQRPGEHDGAVLHAPAPVAGYPAARAAVSL